MFFVSALYVRVTSVRLHEWLLVSWVQRHNVLLLEEGATFRKGFPLLGKYFVDSFRHV